MSAVIPLSVEDFRSFTNLPDDTRIRTIYSKHTARVLSLLAKAVTTEDYGAVTDAGGDDDTDRKNAFEYAFSRLCLSIMLPVLNTNTAGKGIITETGFDQGRTKLLSGAELKQRQNDLILEALNTLEEYLSDDGAVLLASYQEKPKSFFRCAVITQTEDDPTDDLWDDLNIWCG